MYEKVRIALNYLNSEDRNVWMKAGAGIKSELGDSGFELWDEWSRQASNYDAKMAQATWKSFKVERINIGTLFYEAKKQGFIFEKNPIPLSKEEIQARKDESRQRLKAQQQKEKEEKEEAIKKSQERWEKARPLSEAHPYLLDKQIAHPSIMKHLRQEGENLLIPLKQFGKVMGIQTISPTGDKRFNKNATLGSSNYILGSWDRVKQGKKLFLCEGFATGASLYLATGVPVVICFTGSNLEKVAEKLNKQQGLHVMIAGDVDRSGMGEKYAYAAQKHLPHSTVYFPKFTEEELSQEKAPSDFNDLAKLRGLAHLKTYFLAPLEKKEDISIHYEQSKDKVMDIKKTTEHLTDQETSPKYKILYEDSILEQGIILYRIQALRDFGDIKKGELGGYIQQESNLSHEGNAWVGLQAKVYESARLLDNAIVTDNAKVLGYAKVAGNAKISDEATVKGFSLVCDHALVQGKAEVSGHATVSEHSQIMDNAKISDHAHLYGNAIMRNQSEVKLYAKVYDNALIEDNALIRGFARIYDEARIYENAFVTDTTVRGHASVGYESKLGHGLTLNDHVSVRTSSTKLMFTYEDVELHGNVTIQNQDYIEGVNENTIFAPHIQKSLPRKYEFVFGDSFVTEKGVVLYRIRALRDFGDVKAGDLGGYVEYDGYNSYLSHQGNAWVYYDAKLSRSSALDNAQVRDSAFVELSNLSGNCIVKDNAYIISTNLDDHATVGGNAKVSVDTIKGRARVDGFANVIGQVTIQENAHLTDNVKLSGDKVVIGGDVKLEGNFAKGDLKNTPIFTVQDKEKIQENQRIHANEPVR